MNFQHTEDRRMLADTLNRFVSEQYGFETRDRLARSDVGFSRELWGQFAELGIIGALFSEAEGGFGGDGFDIAVVFESLGRGLVVEPFLGALIVGRAVAHAGNDAQKALIANLIDGSVVAALAHEEPGSHYELSNVTTRAVRRANGWVLAGAKAVVQQAEEAGVLLVSARTSGADDAEDGISLFLVPRDAAGLTVRGYRKIDGGRAAEVVLDDVCVGDDALLGPHDGGFATLEHSIGFGVLALCAEALGAMDVAKDFTLEYLRTRKQFGVAIGSFQSLQHRAADMFVAVEQARSMSMFATMAADFDDPKERAKAVAAAKVQIGKSGKFVGQQSIQLHGGIGMTQEAKIGHYFKRLTMIENTFGDTDYHMRRVSEAGGLV
jgi:pimeloyl-CoA dehydrogenase small subunit